MSSPAPDARSRLDDVRTRIARAAARIEGGRPARLVAISKTFGPETIEPLLAAGQRVFGENRVQEAQAKWPGLKQRHRDIELHLVGPLQTNKVRDAVALFDVIESVDRDKLARALSREMALQNRRLSCFVQVNIGQEPQKAGIAPEETADFVARCKQEHGLDIVGLMCIPPLDQPPGPYFAQLAQLARHCGLEQLSMGMSADFETAVLMGATHVRVGSGLFGTREKH